MLARLPLRESRWVVAVCAVIFVGLLGARLAIPRPMKAERSIERRLAEGRTVRSEAYFPVWLHHGLRLNVWLAGLVLVASPWLGRRIPADAAPSPPQPSPWSRGQTLACLAVMAAVGWHHFPRLFHSMWGDEEFNASRYILEEVVRTPDGSIEIRPRPWVTTLWNCRKPTNHMGYSLLARACHEVFFRPGFGPRDPWFREAWLRLPVFLSGLLAVPAVLWTLRVWGLSGWWPVLFLACHPWFLRFGVDGRSYGLVILLSTVMMGVAGRALHTGRWRWWTLLGALQFYMLWCNAQSVYLCAAVHLMVMGFLCRRSVAGEWRKTIGARWMVSGALVAGLVIGVLAPCWPQLRAFMASQPISADLDSRWWVDSLCAWVFGQPWMPWAPADHPYVFSLSDALRRHPILVGTAVAASVTALATGIAALFRRRSARLLSWWIPGAPALMLGHVVAAHIRPYDWYLAPFLPGLAMTLAPAFDWLSRRVGRRPALAVGIATLVLYAFATHRPRHLLRHHSIESSRQSVASCRPVTNPRHPDIDKAVITAGYVMFTEGYDPALRRFETVGELRALMADADHSRRDLFVNVGFIEFAREKGGSEAASITRMIENPELFELTGRFHGLMPQTTRHVFRYRRPG